MPKCDFNKVANFQKTYYSEHVWVAASGCYVPWIRFVIMIYPRPHLFV